MLPELKKNKLPAQAPTPVPAHLAEVLDIDEKPHLRFGWAVLLIGFVGFILWAALVPLDQGAPLSGTVVVSGNSKTIQHPYGGVVERIHVQEGSEVKEGDTLITFNDVRSDSALEVARTQWISAMANQNRLSSELAGRDEIVFAPWLQENSTDPRVTAAIALQRDLFASRKATLRNELQALRETEAALGSSLRSMNASLADRREQLRLSKAQLDAMRTMANEGYLPVNRALEAERQSSLASAAVSDDLSAISRTQGQLGEIRQRIALVNNQFMRESQTQLTETQRVVEELDERLRTAGYDNQYRELKSPVNGVVTNVQVHTEGGVVQAGASLMQVVPIGESLEISAQLAVQLIDKVSVGSEVQINFPAFNRSTTPQVTGLVRAVGADRVVEERTGMPYYLVKVQVLEKDMGKLKGLNLQPGMPADLLVKTGERTLLNYLVKPIQDHLGAALKEE